MSSVSPPNTVLTAKAGVYDAALGNWLNGLDKHHQLQQQPPQDIRGPHRQDSPLLTVSKNRRHLHTLTAVGFRPWEQLTAGQKHILNQQSLALGVPGVDIQQPIIKASPGGYISAKLPARQRQALKRRKEKNTHRLRQTENIVQWVEALFRDWLLRE